MLFISRTFLILARDSYDRARKLKSSGPDCRNSRFLPAQTAVETYPAFAKLNATLLGRNQQSDQFSRRARAGMGPVIETIRRQCLEHSDEGGVLWLPSLNEELSVA
jgi:hypothetical protein